MSRLDMSAVGELYDDDGERASALEFFLASAFLFLGTSCNLNASVDCDCDVDGDACRLRERSLFSAGDSWMEDLRFRSESPTASEVCRPFSWNAMCGLEFCRSAEADRDRFSLSISR